MKPGVHIPGDDPRGRGSAACHGTARRGHALAIRVDLLDGAGARRVEGELRQVCAQGFAASPFFKTAESIAGMFKGFPAETKRPGFTLAVARDPRGRIVGLAYGHPLGPDTGWWLNVLDPVPA